MISSAGRSASSADLPMSHHPALTAAEHRLQVVPAAEHCHGDSGALEAENSGVGPTEARRRPAKLPASTKTTETCGLAAARATSGSTSAGRGAAVTTARSRA